MSLFAFWPTHLGAHRLLSVAACRGLFGQASVVLVIGVAAQGLKQAVLSDDEGVKKQSRVFVVGFSKPMFTALGGGGNRNVNSRLERNTFRPDVAANV